MGMIESEKGFQPPLDITNEQAMALGKIKQLTDKLSPNEKLHFGIKDELDRHKQVMEKLEGIERTLMMITTHFKIYPIVGSGSDYTRTLPESNR